MSRNLLPSPGDCNWLEATENADLIERLANHLDKLVGPKPPYFSRIRWEWQGRRDQARYIRHVSEMYRRRANELRYDA